MNAIETAPRDGSRVLLIRKQRTKGPLLRNLFAIGKWYITRQHWTVDSRTIYALNDSQIAGWYDLHKLINYMPPAMHLNNGD